MGWPDIDEMTFFSEAVLPLVRARERGRGPASGTTEALGEPDAPGEGRGA